ncbi:MAG: glycosyltransferase family 4 protein [Candidatus Sericytochromatia bacterium]|nr:glycosyltransferase family 4 protein [Candidatus Sericytochromatia bacterium]
MRIGLLAPLAYPIPPRGYGGTERVVASLADGLSRRGHTVTLFASGDSRCAARLRTCLPHALGNGPGSAARQALWEGLLAREAVASARELDILHDHTKSAGIQAATLADCPVLTTVHNALTPKREAVYSRHLGHPLVALSQAHARTMQGFSVVEVVPNGVPLPVCPRPQTKDSYLLFLGRLDAPKGADWAARLAARYDLPLVMAGRVANDDDFFATCVAPWLNGGRRRYVGEVDGEVKWQLLAGARALLFPIRWAEPFGLVMVEAMAVGTPVVAFGRGAVPEVVEDGVTGRILPSEADEPAWRQALMEVRQLDPQAARTRVAHLFSEDAMVERYLKLYQRLIAAPQELMSRTAAGGPPPP